MILDQAKLYALAGVAAITLAGLGYQAYKIQSLRADLADSNLQLEKLASALDAAKFIVSQQATSDAAQIKELEDEANKAKQALDARTDSLARRLRSSPKLHCAASVPATSAASSPAGAASPGLRDTTPDDLAAYARDAEDDASRLDLLQAYVRRVCLRSAPLSLSLRPISTPSSQGLIDKLSQVPHVVNTLGE